MKLNGKTFLFAVAIIVLGTVIAMAAGNAIFGELAKRQAKKEVKEKVAEQQESTTQS